MNGELFLAVLFVLHAYVGSGTGQETCKQYRSECHGASKFHGVRCKDKLCQCDVEDACDNYYSMSVYAKKRACETSADCLGDGIYKGISCMQKQCSCSRHYGCGDNCLPSIRIAGLAPTLGDICVYDYYTEVPSWKVKIKVHPAYIGDIYSSSCNGINWWVKESEWTIHKIHAENKPGNYVKITKTQVMGPKFVNGDTYTLDSIIGYGVFSLKVKVTHKTNVGFSGLSIVFGYFSRACAFSYEETTEPSYQTSQAECNFGWNTDEILMNKLYGIQHTHQLPNCAETELLYLPTDADNSFISSSFNKYTKCKIEILCPGSCSDLLNPQEETFFTMLTGCPLEVYQVELYIRKCPVSNPNFCYHSDVIRDSNPSRSVKYKPKPEDLTWLYHGLFVNVYFTRVYWLEKNVLVRFGPIPEAGVCSVEPDSGYALKTTYNITCSGFTAGDLDLKYAMFSHNEPDISRAVKIYTGDFPNKYDILLQPGKEASGSLVYIWVKAFVFNGAHVIVPLQTHVYPPSADEGTDILDLAESFMSVDKDKNASIVGDLISHGNAVEAAHLLGVIAVSLNLNENDTKSDGDESEAEKKTIDKRTEVRTHIVEVLTELPVNDFETVSSAISVLNEATEVKGEISEKAQDVATDLYNNLAEGFDSFVENQTEKTEVVHTAESILNGVTRILDINTDAGSTEMHKLDDTDDHTADGGTETTKKQRPTSEDSKPDKQRTVKIEKVKNSTAKLLKTVDTVTNAMMQLQQPGANATVFKTDTMLIGIQKVEMELLSVVNNKASGTSNSSANFKFPEMSAILPSANFGVKMLYLEKNPYVWDPASDDITSPVMDVSLKDKQNSPVVVNNMSEPVTVSLSSPGVQPSSENTFQVTLQRFTENTTSVVAQNIAFDSSSTNMLSFNISVDLERTVSLHIAALSNITSYKMLIRTDHKPTFDEIIEEGFLYPEEKELLFQEENELLLQEQEEILFPEELENSTYTNFTVIKSHSVPLTPYQKRTIYLAPNNSLWGESFSGVYYIGLTLDLEDNVTMLRLREDYPDCLWDNALPGCKEIVNVTIDIQTLKLGCFYWDEANDKWSGQGCEVSPYTTRETIECLCTHLTSFSGSVLVLPNFVDPIGDAKLFLTFFDNPVVVTTVIIVWFIYFFLVHWARRADKLDQQKVGVVNCLDNKPDHKYLYLVCVVTGWWREAGTTANVFIFLKGSRGTSSNHCLSTKARPCFQTGNEDWFLITTEQSLGNLQHITLWHDNMGASPHWYLNHVYIKDKQKQKSWNFIYNDWLAVDRGALMLTSVTMEAVGEEEIKLKQKHNFMMKSTNDLRDGHLWLSIFSKPARSTFTRVQRLTCALCLLLMTMLTNIMFYGIPTNDPEDQAGVGGITISLSSIIIGIESSLIMFPVNLLILQLFLKVKPRPRNRVVKDQLEDLEDFEQIIEIARRMTAIAVDGMLEKLTDSASKTSFSRSDHGIDAISESIGSDGSIKLQNRSNKGIFKPQETASMTSHETTSEKNLIEEKTQDQPKSQKIFPWWFLYIAWCLVITLSLISSYFVMLYGLKYGYNTSVSWLVSFLTGFTQSAFVQQPIKVICVAVVITIIFKKPAQFEDYGDEIELDEDEVYLHEISGPEEIHSPTIQPLTKRLLAIIRQRLYIEWLMDMTIRDIVLYVIYMVVVTVMVHGDRNISLAYRNTETLENILVNANCEECSSLEEVNSVESMFEYIEAVMVPSLTDMSAADGPATAGSTQFLLGTARLRQQRIKKGTCPTTTEALIKRLGLALPECVGSYWIGDEDTGSYRNAWNQSISTAAGGLWSYQSQWTLETIPYTGTHGTYSGGGFVLEMSTKTDLVALLESIKNTQWIDDRTRVIFVEFTLYNPNANLFSVVMIVFEFSNTGGIFPDYEIFTTILDHYSTSLGSYLVLCEVLFICFNLSFTYTEVTRFRKIGRKEYFQDKWSYMELIQLALSYTVVVLFFQRLVLVNSVTKEYRDSNTQTFISFFPAISADFVLGYVMAFQIAVTTVKAVKLLQFNKKTFMISDTFSFAKSNLFNFAFMFALCMMAFGHFTTLAFGPLLSNYQSIGRSLISIFNFALGSADLLAVYEANRLLGPIYLIVFVVCFLWCLLTVFVSILNFAISDSKALTATRQNKFELIDYITKKIKTAL